MASPPPSEPLFFRRILKETVWGGRNLATWLGESPDFSGPLGESWELSDVAGQETLVAEGPFEGKTLCQLLEEHAEAILGSARPHPGGKRFPLLVKFLEAEQDLSVQVHPASDSSAYPGQGKSECWYFLEARPGANLICGLKPGTDKETFAADASTSAVESHLQNHAVNAGSFLMVEAGQVHAIRPGVVLCEIQQTSDTTFRLYDWNRLGLDGKARETHPEKALEVVDFESPAPSLVQPEFQTLAEGLGWETAPLTQHDAFHVRILKGNGAAGFGPFEKPRVLTVVNGAGKILFGKDEIREMKHGDTTLVPACCSGYVLDSAQSFTLLESIPQ